MKEIEYHQEVAREVDEAMAWYDERSSGLGLEFLAELEDAVRRIRRHPASGPPHRIPGCRKRFLRRFPHIVFYVELEHRIWVVAVAHPKREENYWADRLDDLAD